MRCAVFQSLIRESYGEKLLDNEHRRTIDEIKWRIEKDFIQQALTLVESKMPTEIIRNNFLYCPELFDKGSSGTFIKTSERDHLEEKDSPKKPWEPRTYCIYEQKKARTEINVLVRLHMQLKQIRNDTNHAGNKDRFDINIIRNALKIYVELYEAILQKLSH